MHAIIVLYLSLLSPVGAFAEWGVPIFVTQAMALKKTAETPDERQTGPFYRIKAAVAYEKIRLKYLASLEPFPLHEMLTEFLAKGDNYKLSVHEFLRSEDMLRDSRFKVSPALRRTLYSGLDDKDPAVKSSTMSLMKMIAPVELGLQEDFNTKAEAILKDPNANALLKSNTLRMMANIKGGPDRPLIEKALEVFKIDRMGSTEELLRNWSPHSKDVSKVAHETSRAWVRTFYPPPGTAPLLRFLVEIGDKNNPEIARILTEAANHPVSELRSEARNLLQESDLALPSDVISKVGERMGNDADFTTLLTRWAELKKPGALEELEKRVSAVLASDAPNDVKVNMLARVGQAAANSNGELLSKALLSPDFKVRNASVVGLLEVGNPSTLAIQNVLKSLSPNFLHDPRAILEGWIQDHPGNSTIEEGLASIILNSDLSVEVRCAALLIVTNAASVGNWTWTSGARAAALAAVHWNAQLAETGRIALKRVAPDKILPASIQREMIRKVLHSRKSMQNHMLLPGYLEPEIIKEEAANFLGDKSPFDLRSALAVLDLFHFHFETVPTNSTTRRALDMLKTKRDRYGIKLDDEELRDAAFLFYDKNVGDDIGALLQTHEPIGPNVIKRLISGAGMPEDLPRIVKLLGNLKYEKDMDGKKDAVDYLIDHILLADSLSENKGTDIMIRKLALIALGKLKPRDKNVLYKITVASKKYPELRYQASLPVGDDGLGVGGLVGIAARWPRLIGALVGSCLGASR